MSGEKSAPGRGAPARPTVLLVDDSAEHVEVLAAALEGDYRLKVANNGLKALDLAASASDPLDLILLDLLMPGMDGYEVLKRLKKSPRTKAIPVLIMTAVEEFESEKLGFELGCADYITKPINPVLVRARVKTHVEQYRLLKSEQELLEKTLKGALGMLVEMLSVLDPESFGIARRMGALSERVGRVLGMESSWIMGLAAVLSQIGVVTIPDQVLAKARRQAILTTVEREMYSRIPEIGSTLIRNIPRLEDVADIVLYMQKNINGTGFPHDAVSGQDIPLGSRILRVVYDYMNLVAQDGNPKAALNDMYLRTSWYDMDVLQTLEKVLRERPRTALTRPVPRLLEDLRPGDVLATSLEAEDGRVFVQSGTILGETHLERIRNVARFVKLKRPVLVEGEP